MGIQKTKLIQSLRLIERERVTNIAAVPGTLAAGWKLAKGALAAQAALGAGRDPVFMTQKTATALFFAQHILPECNTEQVRIQHGARSLLEHFSLKEWLAGLSLLNQPNVSGVREATQNSAN